MSVCLLTLISAPNAFPEVGNEVDTTDLVFPQDSNRVMLTIQRPLVRVVIQDSFDILHASLHFTDAFPKASVALQFVRDALLRSALNHMPGAGRIYQRLLHDKEYLWKIIPLVSRLSHSFITIAEHIHSRVLGFLFTDRRSKSVAVPLLGRPCWRLVSLLKSRRPLRSNSGITFTLFHEHQM